MKSILQMTIPELVSSLVAKLTLERDKIDAAIAVLTNCDHLKQNGDVTTYRTITKRRMYKKRQQQTPAEAEASVTAALDAPTTFGGACKRVMREAKSPLTVANIFEIIGSKWPTLIGDKLSNNVDANVRYWTAKGYCEKIGEGSLATYRIVAKEFFSEIET